jgi:2-dehydro-3-deoxyphosphogluconate aldolase/(4S)-4-hydroxy-2-oxoglutarate aldolase
MTLLELLGPAFAAPVHGPVAAPVIPVIVLADARDAVPLARACVAGGVRVLEVTLRTPAGLEAIRRIAAEVPEAIVGAGTVTREADLAAAVGAGARFVVSPGFDRELAAAARDHGTPWMPGVMTPSEVMQAAGQGLSLLKFFPAAAAGGTAMLQALAGPFPDLQFCPTGGVGLAEAARYLALPNVFAVGGSWLTPAATLAARDWSAVTALAREAAVLGRAKAPAVGTVGVGGVGGAGGRR